MAAIDPASEALGRIYLAVGERLRQSLLAATVQGFDRRRSLALLEQVKVELRLLDVYVADWERRQIGFQFEAGREAADARLAQAGASFRQEELETWHRLAREPLEALARDIAGQRGRFLGFILRQSQDYLRDLSSGEIARGLGIGDSPYAVGEAIREGAIRDIVAQQEGRRAVDSLLRRIDSAAGVVYSDGSVHSLEAYGEMSARTGMMRSFTEATSLRYEQAGVRLVTVSSHGTLCFLCQPLEGRTFALDEAGVKFGFPLLQERIPRHPNCRHSLMPALVEFGPYEKPEPAALSMTDRELYARMRDDVPGGKQRMEWARKGFRNVPEAERLTAQGAEFGSNYNPPGIETRRIAATRRVLESRGKLTYRQAMEQD